MRGWGLEGVVGIMERDKIVESGGVNSEVRDMGW